MIDAKFAKYLLPSDDEEYMFSISLTTPKEIVDELREADKDNYKFYGYHIVDFEKFDKEYKNTPKFLIEEMRKLGL